MQGGAAVGAAEQQLFDFGTGPDRHARACVQPV